MDRLRYIGNVIKFIKIIDEYDWIWLKDNRE